MKPSPHRPGMIASPVAPTLSLTGNIQDSVASFARGVGTRLLLLFSGFISTVVDGCMSSAPAVQPHLPFPCPGTFFWGPRTCMVAQSYPLMAYGVVSQRLYIGISRLHVTALLTAGSYLPTTALVASSAGARN